MADKRFATAGGTSRGGILTIATFALCAVAIAAESLDSVTEVPGELFWLAAFGAVVCGYLARPATTGGWRTAALAGLILAWVILAWVVLSAVLLFAGLTALVIGLVG